MTALSIDEASRVVTDALAATCAFEDVPLRQANGRFCPDAMFATGDQPRFDSAAMDGWALSGWGGDQYRIVGESRAGCAFDRTLEAGEAVYISTGAMIPPGASAVVRREQGVVADGMLTALEIVPGRDMRRQGCDFRRGAMLLPAGRRIDHFDIARLAASGLSRLRVARRPHVALLATGDEIVAAGHKAPACGNYDALSPALWARMAALGVEVDDLGVARDDDAGILERACASDAGLLVVTGGASGGRHDRVRSALMPMGLEVLVPAVRMRPGKPFWCGRWGDGRLVAGLPGNPVAALATLELFLVPALLAAQGLPSALEWSHCHAARPTGSAGAERVRFARRHVAQVDVIGMEDSAALSPLLGANALCRQTEFGTRVADLAGWAGSISGSGSGAVQDAEPMPGLALRANG